MRRLIAFAVLAGALLVGLTFYAGAIDPHRQMNNPPSGESCKVYAQAKGSYQLDAAGLLGGIVPGSFSSIVIDTNTSKFSLPLSIIPAGIFGTKGNAWVLISVVGPANISIGEWKSEMTPFSFGIFDVPKAGSFASGQLCMWVGGNTDWLFKLMWDSGEGGAQEIARAIVQKAIVV
jgi:hypothetical protein